MFNMRLSIWIWVSLNGLMLMQNGVHAQFWSICIAADDQCPNEHIDFWLHKKNSTDAPIKLDLLNISSHHFEPRLPVRILIHGFHGDSNLTPNEEVRPILLAHQDVHVISVEYGRLAHFPCYYPWAVENAHVVAKCLARLLDTLVRNGIYQSEDFHLIGFSLGAQIAGLTANYVEHPLEHITGKFQVVAFCVDLMSRFQVALDPARPAFTSSNLTAQLDPSDAKFVDVIHTDPVFYGKLTATGHVDFYMNLRNIFQPGCDYWKYGLRNCNHFRSADYYAESIITQVGFWSSYCVDWWEYLFDTCWQHGVKENVLMGYFVPKTARGSYFVSTHSKPPYAQGPDVDVQFELTDSKPYNETLNTL